MNKDFENLHSKTLGPIN